MERVRPAILVAAILLGCGGALAQSGAEKWQLRRLDGASVYSLIKAGYELKAATRDHSRGVEDVYLLQKGTHLVRCLELRGGVIPIMDCQEFVEPYVAPATR